MDPIALDLRGSGIDNTDPNTIANLADYSKPLTDYLQSIPDDEKVKYPFCVAFVFLSLEFAYSFVNVSRLYW